MEYKHRIIEGIANDFNAMPVISLAGPRQVGKSTFLEYLSDNLPTKPRSVTLDDLALRIQANEDPESFLDALGTPLIIDEFQYAPNLLSYIKMRVDQARKKALFETHQPIGTLYYLTGSQVFETMEQISESLAGRILPYNLYAFNAREIDGTPILLQQAPFIPDHTNIGSRTHSKHLDSVEMFERIIRGCYPELYINPNLRTDQFYSGYLKTYLERDVRSIAAVKDETKFLRFLSCLAARTGQEYNASSIASDVQIDSKTADEWLSIAKNTYLVHLVQPYSNNANSRAIKRPKLYFTDTGLASYLAGYSGSELLQNSAYSGAIFETYVFNEILKSFWNCGIDPRNKLYYYRSYDQKEIDLIIHDEGKLYPIEIKKTSTTPTVDATKNFATLEKEAGENQVMPGTIICNVKEIVPAGNGVIAVPVEYI